jgi:site-specific recombinase XerD
MRLSTLSEQYLAFADGRGASPKTIETYKLAHTQFIEHLHGQGLEDELRHFTPEHVDAFTTALSARGLRGSSIHVKLAALHSLGVYGVKTRGRHNKYLLAENPLDRIYRPKRQRPAEKYLYLHEVRQILAAPSTPAVSLALRLLLDTGCRVSELANATVRDLSLDGERVLLAVIVKGGRHRSIALGAEVAAPLLESLRLRETRPTDPLLVNDRGDRYTRASLSEAVLRHAVRAGVTRIPVRAHVLRHSVATLASATGADVPTIAAMLNHSGLGTVSRYVHRQDAVDAAREAVRRAITERQHD